MPALRHITRFLAGVALLALAAIAAVYGLTLYWDIGLPGQHEVGVMYTTSINFGGVTLAGWQMYASYIVVGAVSITLAGAGTLLLGKTVIRLTRRCSEPRDSSICVL